MYTLLLVVPWNVTKTPLPRAIKFKPSEIELDILLVHGTKFDPVCGTKQNACSRNIANPKNSHWCMVRKRRNSLECYTYSPAKLVPVADDRSSRPSSASLSVVDEVPSLPIDFADDEPKVFEALVTVSIDLSSVGSDPGLGGPEWYGAIGIATAEVVSIDSTSTGSVVNGPLMSSLSNFVFPSGQFEILKIEAIRACARYLHRRSPQYLGGEVGPDDFFMFTANKQSLILDSHPKPLSAGTARGETCYCYCLKSFELIPLTPSHPPDDSGVAVSYALLVPVTYVLISQKPFIDLFFQLLLRVKSARLDSMRAYWTSGRLDRADWFSNPSALESLLVQVVDSGWPFPCESLTISSALFAPLTCERPPVLASGTVCEKSEFYAAWFSGQLFKNLQQTDFSTIIVALLLEYKVMVVSESQARRSAAVLGLIGILGGTARWPHPCLASPPGGIAGELPNAPTPVIAGIPRNSKFDKKSKNKRYFNCLFVDIDLGQIHWCELSDETAFISALNDFNLIASSQPSLGDDAGRIEWYQRQRDIRGAGGDVGVVAQVADIREKIEVVFQELLSFLVRNISECETFQKTCELVDSRFSELRKSVFRSQSFQLFLQSRASAGDVLPRWSQLI